MAKPLVLQINSLQAIERLIGGEGEVEIDLRNSVVQAFANKHLRGVAQELLGTVTERAIRDGIQAEVLEKVSVRNGQWNRQLVDALRGPIKEAVSKHVKELIDQEMRAAWTEHHGLIEKAVAGMAKHIADSIKPQIADSAIEQLVVQRINKMLAGK